MASIDETILINKPLPKSWKCPHCGKYHKFDSMDVDIFFENFKLFRQCMKCGYVHYWELRLTDDFKRKVMDVIDKEIAK